MIAKTLGSAFTQLGVVLVLMALVYGVRAWFARKSPVRVGFREFLGLVAPVRQFDRTFAALWCGVVLFGAGCVFLQFHLGGEWQALLTGPNSPYARILSVHGGFPALCAGWIYCFVQASASEEIFFRGWIGKRLTLRWGARSGNVLQALVFWLLHWAMVGAISGAWFSALQGFVFVSTFGLAWVLGYANSRGDGRSIVPSWILHGSGNFASFLALAWLWR